MVSISFIKFVSATVMVAIFLGPHSSIASQENDRKPDTISGQLRCDKDCGLTSTHHPVESCFADHPVDGAVIRLACTYNHENWYDQMITKTGPDGTFFIDWTNATDITTYIKTGTCAIWIDWAPPVCGVPVKPDFGKNGYKVNWFDVINIPQFGISGSGCLLVSPSCPSN